MEGIEAEARQEVKGKGGFQLRHSERHEKEEKNNETGGRGGDHLPENLHPTAVPVRGPFLLRQRRFPQGEAGEDKVETRKSGRYQRGRPVTPA